MSLFCEVFGHVMTIKNCDVSNPTTCKRCGYESPGIEWCKPSNPLGSYQNRVNNWMQECFGKEISADPVERNHRFLEEALELVQACDCTASEAHQLVDYVFNRPVGEKHQEVGGVAVTFAALCNAIEIPIDEAGETELARIWVHKDAIKAKQAKKPKHSPLPM